jgi:hypothetical protein
MCMKSLEELLALNLFLFLPRCFLRVQGRFGRLLGLFRRHSPRRRQLLEGSVEVLGKIGGKESGGVGNIASSRRQPANASSMSQLQRATKSGLLTTVDFTLALTFPKDTGRRLATHSISEPNARYPLRNTRKINSRTFYSQSSSLSSFALSFFSSFGLPGARLVAPETIS